MAVTIDGTTGITTPGLTNTGTNNILVDLTTTGNTTIGNETTDTFVVGVNGLVKDTFGNVGIGTTSPGVKLDVVGTMRANTSVIAGNSSYGITINKNSLTFTGANSVFSFTKPTPTASNAGRFDIPVGSLNGALSGPFWNGAHFAVPETITNAVSANEFPRTSHFYSYSTTVNPTDLTYNIFTGNSTVPQHLSIGTATSANIKFFIANSEAMRIDYNSKVGIGTSPSSATTAQLQVTGGTVNASTLLTSYSQATVAIVPKSTSGYSLAIASGTSDVPQLQVSANGTAAGDLYLQPYGGNLGIGFSGTALGNSVLNVNTGIVARTLNGTSVTPYFQTYNGNAGTDLKIWRIGSQSAGNLVIETVNDAYSSASLKLYIDATGNVGIGGITSATSLLHVASGTNGTLNFQTGIWASKIYQQNDGAAYNGLIVGNRWAGPESTVFEAGSLYGSSSAWGSFYKITGNGIHIWGSSNSGTERMRIDGSGNLKLSTAGTVIQNSSGNPILQQTGSVLQVVSTIKNDTYSSASTTFVDVTGLSVTITPTSATSKILVHVTSNYGASGGSQIGLFNLVRNSTNIATPSNTGLTYSASVAPYNQNLDNVVPWSIVFLDSPATTSATTYKIQGRVAGGTAYVNRRNSADMNTVSTITVMEIAA